MKKLVLSSILAISLFSCAKESSNKNGAVEEFQSKPNKQSPSCPEIIEFSLTSFPDEINNTKLRIDLNWASKNHQPRSIEIVIGGVSSWYEPTTENSFTIDIYWISPAVVTVNLYNGKIGKLHGDPCFTGDTESYPIFN
jgi:hypothetical protein